MSEEKNDSRINIEDLPQAEQELTSEEASQVQGGLLGGVLVGEADPIANKTKPSGGGDGYKGQIEIQSWS